MAIVEQQKTAALEKSASDLQQQVEQIQVVDDASFAWCKEYGTAAKELEKQIKQYFEEPIRNANAVHKSLTAKRKEALDPVKAVLDMVARKLGKYEEQLRREAEQEAKIAAALAEQERAAEVEETAEQLIDAGKYEAASEHLRHAESLPELHVAPEVHRPEAAKGGRTQTMYIFKVVDESLLPREYLMPDEKAIRAMVKAKKDRAQIPGVKVWPETKHHV